MNWKSSWPARAACSSRGSRFCADAYQAAPGTFFDAGRPPSGASICDATRLPKVKNNMSARRKITRRAGKRNPKTQPEKTNMKTKAKIILKSLADLPADALALAGSIPGRAIEMTRRVLTPPARATRRQVRAARQRSVKFIKDLSARANAPLKLTIPRLHRGWSHGGLNY